MIRSRINYWSCSKFADFVRGEQKPFALGFDEWDEWRDDVRRRRPVRYFLAEEVSDRLQDVLYFPKDIYRTIRAYVDNRFIHKTHCLKTGLRPGSFYELEHRMLHGLFNELKEFVEVDLGTTYASWHEGDFKIRGGKCPEAGLAYLEWAIGLKMDEEYGVSKKSSKYGKPTRQAEVAKEIKEIYEWWSGRDDRPDPSEVSGWSKACEENSKLSEKKTLTAYKKMEAIEKKYDREDDDMLFRLIKIRRDLWC
jgi:hypothetical protein